MVGTTPHIEEMVRRFIQKLAQRICIERVFIFGSRARGEALHTSDVDIAIISSDFGTMSWIERLEFLSLNWNYDVPADCFGYTPAEFEARREDRLDFVYQIYRDGKMLNLS
jgi:predicted nucleotidyltransferase